MLMLYCTIRNHSKMFFQKIRFKRKVYLAVRNRVSIMSSTERDTTELCISKSLDTCQIQYKNQFACLLTRCTYCSNMTLYINKITGNCY